MGTLWQVALGGAFGAVARYITTLAATRALGAEFPYGTVIVNVLGSFAMGVLFVLLMERGLSRHAPLLLTGVLGGFTTFSAFSLETLVLVERGHSGAAVLYVAASVGLSLLAVIGGLALARGGFA